MRRAPTPPAVRPTGLFQEEPLSFEYPAQGAPGVKLREPDVPPVEPAQAMPGAALRSDGLRALPQLSEFEVVRHFTRLSKLNVSIDAAMYPLGSCTMKYNPRINEVVARLPGLAQAHPLMPDALVQGTLEIFWRLTELLKEITGFAAGTLQPAAGAQGELTGVLLIRARHEARGQRRRYMLVPDSAHGTNPASAHIAGFEVREVKSLPDGTVDLAHLAQAMDADVAGLMLTNPNTLGLFESHVERLCELVHDAGALVYLDGANMNALLGVAKPGHMGVDVMHFNLHKTFSTPHGGGGPGSGPVAAHERLEPYLPGPVIRAEGGRYWLDHDRPGSIGRVHAFYGNVGMWIRALAYIRTLGAPGLEAVTRHAVLNANYVLASLRGTYEVPHDRTVMHECVLSDRRQHASGVTTADIAKRLMDYGFHPPTIYFPLVVPGALMIEPTECEPLDALDGLIDALRAISEEARENPSLVTEAPHTTWVRRVDEVQAARRPRLRWKPAEDT
jgi:glycine cleavage system P protein (glycine dehydrogenase) subunit 2